MTNSGKTKAARRAVSKAWLPACLAGLSLFGALTVSAAFATPDAYTPLWLYNGSWQVTRKEQAPGAAPDKLTNLCSLAGRFFVCEQSVNGVPGALLIFIPAGKPGLYYTQNVRPEGPRRRPR